MSNEEVLNPYASPKDTSGIVPFSNQDAEYVRRQYLSHEQSVKSIGTLYWLGGILGSLVTAIYFIGGVGMVLQEQIFSTGLVLIVLSMVVGALSGLQVWVAIAIGKLQPWSRIAAIVISCIGLIGFPLGTLISGYFLYLLLSKKGVFVFSEEYKRVIAETPHIKYRTSIIVWILVGLLLLLLAVGLIGFIFVRLIEGR